MITPFIRRVATTVVDSGIDTKQTLYTVPTGKKLIVVAVTLRDATDDFLTSITNGVTFGFDAGATDWLPVFSQVELRTLTSASKYFTKFNTAASVRGNAGNTFGAIFSNTSNNSDLTIDVFGYLISA